MRHPVFPARDRLRWKSTAGGRKSALPLETTGHGKAACIPSPARGLVPGGRMVSPQGIVSGGKVLPGSESPRCLWELRATGKRRASPLRHGCAAPPLPQGEAWDERRNVFPVRDRRRWKSADGGGKSALPLGTAGHGKAARIPSPARLRRATSPAGRGLERAYRLPEKTKKDTSFDVSFMVDGKGLEPLTSCTSSRRSTS